MIKKILWLWIFLLSIVSFSSAWKVQEISLSQLPSIYDSNYDLWFLKWWAVLTTFLWQSKSIIAFDSDSFFWWSSNWQPYYYNDSSVQWFFWEYWACDELTWSDSVPTNCSSSPITWDYKTTFMSFFNNVNLWDYVYYDFENNWYSQGSTSWAWANRVWVCWSSSTIHRSLCFRRQYYNCSSCSSTQRQDYWSLVNSQNLSNLSFGAISNSRIGYAPWQKWYNWWWNIEWWSSVWENTIITWNLMYNSCTKWYILNQLEWILHEWFCYAWTYNTWLIDNSFTWNTYVYWYWMTYRDMYKLSKSNWPYYNSYNDWYLSHFDSIKRYKLWQVSVNPFIWEPIVVYSYFNNLYSNYWIDISDLSSKEFSSYWVLNYCNLYFSESDLSSEYTWQYFQYLCNSLSNSDWSINLTTWAVWDPEESIEVLPPWFDLSNNSSSWVVVGVDWSWTLSWETNRNFEWKTFINDFYQKLQSRFQKPVNNLVWIVPWYILVFMFALILFRFLSH